MKKIICTLLILALMLSCTETGDYASRSAGRIPDQEIWNAHISVSRSGEMTSKIYAAHLVKYDNTGNMYIRDSMRIDFYKGGEHTSWLTADSGFVNERNENIVAVGNVVMVSDSGFTAYTDSLFWINDSNKIYTNAAVQVFSEKDTLYGTNFVSDTKFENWTIYDPLGKTSRQIGE
jgi:LPS export ABC transporter protein LptC